MPSQTPPKDLFSRQSGDYARFRPTYPTQLFQYLASLAEHRDLAWDAGTGNGQAALVLAEHFKHVVGTDISPKQLANAPQHPSLEFHAAPAEKTSFADLSVDLITAAQCFHWFRHAEFFEEARRVLKPCGLLALWSYDLCSITPEIDAVVLKLYRDILDPYWEPERRLVEEGYRSVRLPPYFEEITPPAFEMSAEWKLEHLVGYLGTWSALQTYVRKNGANPLEQIDLSKPWGNTTTRMVRWPLAVRIARKSV